MDLKATIDKELFGYRNRILLIAMGALFWAAYCVYDAIVAYPDQIDAHNAVTQLKEDYPEDWRERWEIEATNNGWNPNKEPEERTQGDILTQWIMFVPCFLIGSYCLVSVLVWSRKFIGADEEKLYANGGVEVPFDQITRIDASRWDNKGIAKVYYDEVSGERNVLIDDFKFERVPTNAIFNRIKAAVDDDKIEGLAESEPTEPEEDDVPNAV